ncbi:TatD family hydrolase [uncultured Desulfuromonas sp.]|uniref:TatD family hydrolase n=1 Tax=uncultured Desulfuromonas sp. TaxID=181013 RepID=UPI002AAA6B6B|nr:TatD family hydrolase [uncultured Desulfuromonas sp.]
MSHPSLVDTHAHLDGGRFAEDLEQVIQRADDQGVHSIITVGCDLESSRASIDLAERYPGIYATVGIHPHDAATVTPQLLDELAQLATADKVVAIGEIGLDYYRNHCPHDQQQKAFRQQLALARQCKLPVVIHDRDAHDDVLAILREEKAEEIGGVLHCFSGDIEMAKACLDLGFYLSFTGTITYPKNDALREVIRQVPTERILVETDCPYLAAQPWRGKRNEPSYVVKTAETVAEIKGLTLTDVARITSLNAFELFGVGEVDQASKIAYRIRDSLYLNITNRCSNRCTFCAKFRDFHVKGHQLKLDHEPDFDEVIAAIGDPTGYEEVVFCGYGEPLLRLDLVKEVATWLKQRGIKVRINSDGQANLVHQRNVLPELKGLIDELSISLNAPNTAEYQRICQSCFGAEGYDAVKDFIHQAPTYIPKVIASAVTVPGIDIKACEQLAEELGVEFRTRIYNEVG